MGVPDERIERKLTAIVAADVAGYSRLRNAGVRLVSTAVSVVNFNALAPPRLRPVPRP
jgi:hypothetical protein